MSGRPGRNPICHPEQKHIALGLCKSCYKKHLYVLNREKILKENQESRWLRKYGLSATSYYRLLASQGGKCAICGRLSLNKLLAVDHNHITGEVRGLLCQNCNTGLGQFSESPEMLDRAAEYLRAWEKEQGLE